MFIAPHLWTFEGPRTKSFVDLETFLTFLTLTFDFFFLSPQKLRSSGPTFFWEGGAQCSLRLTFGPSRTRGPKLFVDLEKKNQKLGSEKFLSPTFFRSSGPTFFWEGGAQCSLRLTFGPSRTRGPKLFVDLEKKNQTPLDLRGPEDRNFSWT